MLRTCLTLTLALLLTACADEPAKITPLTLDYTRLGKINLAVGKLEVVNRAPLIAGKDAGYFDQYKPRLADGLYRWGVDRLQAGGTQGRALLTITDSSMVREILPKSDSMSGWFTRQQGEKWRGRVAAELSVIDGPNNFNGKATAAATRSTTIPEEATAGELEGAYRRLLLGLIDDLNVQMDQAVRQHLNPVVVTMP